MKKNVFYSLLLVAVASGLAACGSGSTSSGASTTTDVTPISPPEGYTQAGTTPVATDTTNNTIAVPGTGAYQVWALPASTVSAIAAAGNQLQTQMNSSGMILTTGSTGKLYWITPTISSSIQKVSASGAIRATVEADATEIPLTTSQQATVNSLLLEQNSGTSGTLVGYNIATSTLLYRNSDNTIAAVEAVSGTTVTLDLSGQCGIANNTITLISSGSDSGSSYLAVNTANGIVCVGNLGSGSTFPSPSSIVWTNLSAQAPQSRTSGVNYSPGTMKNYGFHSTSSTSFYGFWSVTSPAAIYRVSGTSNADGTDQVPQTFWDVTTNTAQTQTNSTNTFQATGAPTLPTSYQSCTDAAGNLYVAYPLVSGSDVLQIYALIGSAWSSASQKSVSGSGTGFVFYPAVGAITGCNISTANGTTTSVIAF